MTVFGPEKTKESADGVDNNGNALNETLPGILPGAESEQNSIATPSASHVNGTQGTSNEDKPISFKQQLNEGKLYLTQKKFVEFASHLEHRFSNFRSHAAGVVTSTSVNEERDLRIEFGTDSYYPEARDFFMDLLLSEKQFVSASLNGDLLYVMPKNAFTTQERAKMSEKYMKMCLMAMWQS